jgi:hypothetical protein
MRTARNYAKECAEVTPPGVEISSLAALFSAEAGK